MDEVRVSLTAGAADDKRAVEAHSRLEDLDAPLAPGLHRVGVGSSGPRTAP